MSAVYAHTCIYVHCSVCCRSLFLQNIVNAGSAFKPSDVTPLISDTLEHPADTDKRAIDLLLGRYTHISFSNVYSRYTNGLMIYSICLQPNAISSGSLG